VNWTATQEQVWELCAAGDPPTPSGDQTLEQAIQFYVSGFLRACDFEGVEAPSRESVETRMRAMLAPVAVK
jgi:hypothetical protein